VCPHRIDPHQDKADAFGPPLASAGGAIARQDLPKSPSKITRGVRASRFWAGQSYPPSSLKKTHAEPKVYVESESGEFDFARFMGFSCGAGAKS
jgi:hypothetical protein